MQKLGRFALGNNVVNVRMFISSLLYLRQRRIESAIFTPACHFASSTDGSTSECINSREQLLASPIHLVASMWLEAALVTWQYPSKQNTRAPVRGMRENDG